jgi:hypothetical protein
MDIKETLVIIGMVVGIATGAWSLVKLWRLEKVERKAKDAEGQQSDGAASESYAQAAKLSAEEVIRLRGEMKRNEEQYKKDQQELLARIERLEAEVDELKKDRVGCVQLYYQVKSLNGTPVYEPKIN